jgi:hypothetical protein
MTAFRLASESCLLRQSSQLHFGEQKPFLVKQSQYIFKQRVFLQAHTGDYYSVSSEGASILGSVCGRVCWTGCCCGGYSIGMFGGGGGGIEKCAGGGTIEVFGEEFVVG